MEYISLGKDQIRVSRIGFGTGSSGFTGENQQTRLTVDELARLLAYAFNKKGINFWDAAHTYGTYPHIQKALKMVPREKVIISTKFSDSLSFSTRKKVEDTLKKLKTDYIDICSIHGVRNSFEIKMRSGALAALIKAKKKGYIRMIGLSAHGIGAMESALGMEEIDLVFARINWSGASMDAYQESLPSKIVAVPYIKEMARKIIPRALIPSFSAQVESLQSNESEQEIVKKLLIKCSRMNKPVVGFKIFGAGKLTVDIEKSMKFIMSLSYISAFLLGMISQKEVDENILIYEKCRGIFPASQTLRGLPAASNLMTE